MRQASRYSGVSYSAHTVGDLAHVGHRDRLATAGVVGDGHHDERDALGAVLVERGAQPVDVHVALERVVAVHVGELGAGQVERERAAELDVGAGRVEVAVVGDDVAFLAHHREQDALGGAALVRGDDVLEAGDVVDRVAEVEVRRAAGVGLVAAHDAGPLVGAHGAGAAVGEQVDDHVFGAQREDVVAGVAKHLLALLGRRHLDLLDDLDAERFDDRLEHGASRCHLCAAHSEKLARTEMQYATSADESARIGNRPIPLIRRYQPSERRRVPAPQVDERGSARHRRRRAVVERTIGTTPRVVDVRKTSSAPSASSSATSPTTTS